MAFLIPFGWCAQGERVLECARSSLAIIKGGVLITTERDVLNGVTRAQVLQVAKNLMPLELRDFTLGELYNADELFITSTTRGVMAVRQIEDRAVGGGKRGPWTKRLGEAFEQHVERHLEKSAGEKVKSTG
jgi:branched-subunit amino acid aminotransferase/4-amino-4-deoxychorismate lyase